ncbi:MAG: hypothetical protein ACYC5N_08195, partial [Endomicrobiales bacterium]
MDLFKKMKSDGEIPQAEQPAAPVPGSAEQQGAPLPDSEQLAEARRRADENIRMIESRIASEREAWSDRIKEKEEEGISLRARLDMLVRRTEQEREKRESKLGLLQQQIQKDLSEVEKTLEAEIKNWTARISQKEKDLEETKHETVFREARAKMEAEQSLRGLQAALDETELKCRTLERQLLEEQNQWIVKIKSREEEILNIKTQIALHESQLSLEEEKALQAKKEMEAAWQEQLKGLDAKLKSQQAE